MAHVYLFCTERPMTTASSSFHHLNSGHREYTCFPRRYLFMWAQRESSRSYQSILSVYLHAAACVAQNCEGRDVMFSHFSTVRSHRHIQTSVVGPMRSTIFLESFGEQFVHPTTSICIVLSIFGCYRIDAYNVLDANENVMSSKTHSVWNCPSKLLEPIV